MGCIICGSSVNGTVCPRCGYDDSQNREQYPTLADDGKRLNANTALRDAFVSSFMGHPSAEKATNSPVIPPQTAPQNVAANPASEKPVQEERGALNAQAEALAPSQTYQPMRKQVAAAPVAPPQQLNVKNGKRRIGFRLVIAAAVASAAYFACTKFVIPYFNYNAAVQLYEDGKYEEALEAFEALGEYKDSAAQIAKCESAILDQKATVEPEENYVEERTAYAVAKHLTEPLYIGESSNQLQALVLHALGQHKEQGFYNLSAGQEFTDELKGELYLLRVILPNESAPVVGIFKCNLIATVWLGGEIKDYDSAAVDETLKAAILEDFNNHSESESKFDHNGKTILAKHSRVESKYYCPTDDPVSILSYDCYTPMRGKLAALQADTEYIHAVGTAIAAGEASVVYNGERYALNGDFSNGFTLLDSDDTSLFDIQLDYACEAEGSLYEDNLDAFQSSVKECLDHNESEFCLRDTKYRLRKSENEIRVITDGKTVALFSFRFKPIETVYDALCDDVMFRYTVYSAMADGINRFSYQDETFTLIYDGMDYTIENAQGEVVLMISDIAYGADSVDTVLTVDFVKNLYDAMRSGKESFSFVNDFGEVSEALFEIINGNYRIRCNSKVLIIE